MQKKLKNKIFITEPLMPNINDLNIELNEIFQSKQLTNIGEKHKKLEAKLAYELKVQHISLFNNGTIALITALKALELPHNSEVITTPFTFAATPHSIVWNGLKPVFCDITPDTMTIDAEKIEELITPRTSAILGVHVYGFPCNVTKIDKIAKNYNLKVVYDAAHAFSTEVQGKGIGNFGNITMFSFHATKLFNTIEGGCLTFNDSDLADKICCLRNFGIKNEEIIKEIGINGKMNELQAAWGLLNLKLFKKEQQDRAKIKAYYDENISKIKGIRIPKMPDGTTNSYQYYPIIIEDDYHMSRDDLYKKFLTYNIIARKYFYPACHDFECYKNEFSIPGLKIADDIKKRVLCLPYYGKLTKKVQKIILEVLHG